MLTRTEAQQELPPSYLLQDLLTAMSTLAETLTTILISTKLSAKQCEDYYDFLWYLTDKLHATYRDVESDVNDPDILDRIRAARNILKNSVDLRVGLEVPSQMDAVYTNLFIVNQNLTDFLQEKTVHI